MKISTRSRYGLRLMLELALNYERGPLRLNEISKKQSISLKYLSQLVIQLRLAKLINSTRGSKGGYTLSKSPDKITVKDIIEPLEGNLNIIDCLEKENRCNKKNNCTTKEVWRILTNRIIDTLESIKLSTLVEWEKKRELNYFI